MKVLFNLLVASLLSLTALQAQTADDSYFLGKWEVLVKDVPGMGNITTKARFEFNGGKLVGYITDVETKQERKMDTVYIKESILNFRFRAMEMDIYATLAKKDENKASGLLMDNLIVEVTRINEYYTGNWNLEMKEIPTYGNVKFSVRFESKNGIWKGYFTSPGENKEAEMNSVKLDGGKLEMELTIANNTLKILLEKKNETEAVGNMNTGGFGPFEVIATKI